MLPKFGIFISYGLNISNLWVPELKQESISTYD